MEKLLLPMWNPSWYGLPSSSLTMYTTLGSLAHWRKPASNNFTVELWDGLSFCGGSKSSWKWQRTELRINSYFAALIKWVVPWSQPWTGISITIKYSFKSFSFISFSGSVKKWTFKSSNLPRSLLTSGTARISEGKKQHIATHDSTKWDYV